MAAKQLDKSNLGYLGVEYQYKLVKCFVEEPNFFNELYAVVDQNYFTDTLLRTFVGAMKDYYRENNITPSYDMIQIVLNKRSKTDIEVKEWDDLIALLKKTTLEGYVVVKDLAIKFFKQQRLIKAAHQIIEKVGRGDVEQYDDCLKIIQDAITAGDDDDMGHSVGDFQDAALSKDYTISIPTGISKLDETLGGGLDKGKVGLFMAALGMGKTTYCTAIASYAATHKCDMNNNSGWKVLQICFEDDYVDITRKHISRATQIEASEIRRFDEAQKQETNSILNVSSDWDMIKQNIKLMKMRTGEITATYIEKKIQKLTNQGFKPDLVLIDYFECLEYEKTGIANDTEWNREGKTMRKLENMAKDLNIAIWVTTQGGRGSITTELLKADGGGGSIKKQQIAQVIISITRDLEGQDKNSATLAVLKNRSGKAGKVFHNVKYNNGTSTISCDDVMEFDNGLAWEEEHEKIKETQRINTLRELQKAQQNRKNAETGGFIAKIPPNTKF